MTTTATSHLYTVEEAKALEDAEAYELIDGVLKERSTGAFSSAVELWVGALLLDYARTMMGSHWVFGPSMAVHLFPERQRYFRRPDVSLVLRSRIERGELPAGDLFLVPDMVVEVVSPNDNAGELNRKTEDYLAAGVRMIWLVYPDSRTLMLFRPGEPVLRLGDDDVIPGFDVLPGFDRRVRDLFPS